MSALKSAESLTLKLNLKKQNSEDFKDLINEDTAVFFDGASMFFAFIGAMEFGFLYTTIIAMIMSFYAFNEVMSLRARKDKESHIQIKSFWIEWYFFITFNFFVMGKTWMTPQLLQSSGIGIDPYSFSYIVLIRHHALCSFMSFTIGIIFFVISLQEGFYTY
jgi:hypothetical protein